MVGVRLRVRVRVSVGVRVSVWLGFEVGSVQRGLSADEGMINEEEKSRGRGRVSVWRLRSG